ncbi:MAG: methyltransferase domain-containing protein [Desulfuromonadales bacterium]|nr:methyltransferase domain-containing protein [Desulfuromonadales bacterium]
MLPYQLQTVENFIKLLPSDTQDVLEIGSDIGGEVVSAIVEKTGVRAVGINPSPEFPTLAGPRMSNACFLRMDGRSMPFPDNSFDAVLSVATMEHVNGLDVFLEEVARVLRPKGFFYTDFSPIWSSALGHHVYAVVGSKEARFWKPGKNPIPDYGHLLMTPDEMRDYLRSGPCSEELIEPVIHWIYEGDSLNRCHSEVYMEAFQKCPMVIQKMSLSNNQPCNETLNKLHLKYGTKIDFSCSGISGVFRTLPEGIIQSFFWGKFLRARYWLDRWGTRQMQIAKALVRAFRSIIPYI